ncbi:trans-aconitate 2-methyltransferase [Lentzea sp. NBRC 105346]|uniref:trans-aconitate 2-methyltransferase n=1 Tax=Lentzea sp. NBRC 105346 TaxID=3032205 RepID=UPI00255727CE|nr:trans-aconitate 2-methyltransferase [Lentzea sp. NBRC 105346]GLZ33943.1 trans-aconitate 2-methyltransferase [Lentzea sp. NBRC 105346]
MWDPGKYLAFADHRSRPFYELIARVGATSPRRVVDAGCGPGHLTSALSLRWPSAVVEAFDSSPEMVSAAVAAGVPAVVDDVTTWQPKPDTDVLVTNAVLQWVPSHPALLASWASALSPGAWLAMQVPGNFDGQSHALVRSLVPELARDSPVLSPVEYADLLSSHEVDAWETTYVQRLSGPDPVLEWIKGTALRPVRAALDDAEWKDFLGALAPLLREAYPMRPDGTTWFPFRRIFVVAHIR